MKDLPHHIKQLNRKVLRSEKREEKAEGDYEKEYEWDRTEKQKKKQAKEARKQAKQEQVPHPEEPEEKNKLEKSGRVPKLRDRNKEIPHIK